MLELLKICMASFINKNNFAVNHTWMGDLFESGIECRKAFAEIQPVPGIKFYFIPYLRDSAVSIPLDLKYPGRIAERLTPYVRKHWLDVVIYFTAPLTNGSGYVGLGLQFFND